MLLLTMLTACSKNHSTPGLTGNWKLERSGGDGIVGPMPYTGLPRTLQLQADGKYSRYYNGAVSESGVYTLSRKFTPDGLDTILTFINNGNIQKREYRSFGTEMILSEIIWNEAPNEEDFSKIN